VAHDRIRFHLDENVNGAVALGLRRYGVDVTTTQVVGLMGQIDEIQLQFIQREDRVLFTQDVDFLIIASRNFDHPGIIFCKKDTRSIGEVIEGLRLIYEVFTPDEMRGRVEFL
jgi:predicted nuclease of predicted toxin-antitoxin system